MRCSRWPKSSARVVTKAPERVFWGGYSGYFTDLDGHLWEIAYNPHMAAARQWCDGTAAALRQRMKVMTRQDRIAALKAAAKERILILDGSWGVMIQRRGLSEADFRGDRFKDHPGQLKGNNRSWCLTRPDIIEDLHNQYFAAGADISETNTFSSTIIAQDDYMLDDAAVRDINLAGASPCPEDRR